MYIFESVSIPRIRTCKRQEPTQRTHNQTQITDFRLAILLIRSAYLYFHYLWLFLCLNLCLLFVSLLISVSSKWSDSAIGFLFLFRRLWRALRFINRAPDPECKFRLRWGKGSFDCKSPSEQASVTRMRSFNWASNCPRLLCLGLADARSEGESLEWHTRTLNWLNSDLLLALWPLGESRDTGCQRGNWTWWHDSIYRRPISPNPTEDRNSFNEKRCMPTEKRRPPVSSLNRLIYYWKKIIASLLSLYHVCLSILILFVFRALQVF